MSKFRSAVVIVCAMFAAGVGSAPSATAVEPRTKSVTKTITAMCRLNAQPSRRETFVITTTVPRQVRAGSTFTVDIAVPYSVSPESDYGAAYFGGGSGASPSPAFIVVPPGTGSIRTPVTFTATGAAGTTLTWQLGPFGQKAELAGLEFVDVCVPTRAFRLGRTRIT